MLYLFDRWDERPEILPTPRTMTHSEALGGRLTLMAELPDGRKVLA